MQKSWSYVYKYIKGKETSGSRCPELKKKKWESRLPEGKHFIVTAFKWLKLISRDKVGREAGEMVILKDLEGKKKYSWAHGRQGNSIIQGAGQLKQD